MGHTLRSLRQVVCYSIRRVSVNFKELKSYRMLSNDNGVKWEINNGRNVGNP